MDAVPVFVVLVVLVVFVVVFIVLFFFSSRRRHTRLVRDWSSDVCSSDLVLSIPLAGSSLLFLVQFVILCLGVIP